MIERMAAINGFVKEAMALIEEQDASRDEDTSEEVFKNLRAILRVTEEEE